MKKIQTHYSNLQVTEGASIEVIKGAYKHLTQKYHPDKNLNDRERCEKITCILNDAYRVLSDPVLRKQHDESIKEQRAALFNDGRDHNNNNLGSDRYDNTPSSDEDNAYCCELYNCYSCGAELAKGARSCYLCGAEQTSRINSESENFENNAGTTEKRKSSGFLVWIWIAMIGAASYLSYAIYSSHMAKDDISQIIDLFRDGPSYTENQLPENGEMYSYAKNPRVAPLEVITLPGDNYLVKLVLANSQATVMTVFIHGGSTVNLDVPLGVYQIKFASGKQWYGYDKLFGQKTSYSKSNNVLSFVDNGHEITGFSLALYNVNGGNFIYSKINKSQF